MVNRRVVVLISSIVMLGRSFRLKYAVVKARQSPHTVGAMQRLLVCSSSEATRETIVVRAACRRRKVTTRSRQEKKPEAGASASARIHHGRR